MPLTEEEYRRRRPHPNFKSEINCEKLVIKSGKKTEGKLNTFVLAGGILYGGAEDALHPLFKNAWHLQPEALVCIGNGQNTPPLIHVRDLAHCTLCVLEAQPATRYILAVDDAHSTLEEITQTISQALGTGKTTTVPKEEAPLLPGLSQREVDLMLINIRVEPTLVRELPIAWHCQSGLVENMAAVVDEYKKDRTLTPIKICLLGPPASGKTFLARKLSQLYKLHHVCARTATEETLSRLERSARRLTEPAELAPEDTEAAEADREKLAELKRYAADNNGQYEPSQIAQWIKDKINARECLNQGYVLEGFPETEEQAKELFAPVEPAEDAEEGAPDPKTIPEFVFHISASDDFLKERVMNLPEAEAVASGNTPEEFMRRLGQYRALNTDESTVLNYFDFLEIHPVDIDASSADDAAITKQVNDVVGEPHNYGPTEEERAVLEREMGEEKVGVVLLSPSHNNKQRRS